MFQSVMSTCCKHGVLNTCFSASARLKYVHPGHGAGSPCGAALSDKNWSTIGDEKKTNPGLLAAAESREAFTTWVLKGAKSLGQAPQYFV